MNSPGPCNAASSLAQVAALTVGRGTDDWFVALLANGTIWYGTRCEWSVWNDPLCGVFRHYPYGFVQPPQWSVFTSVRSGFLVPPPWVTGVVWVLPPQISTSAAGFCAMRNGSLSFMCFAHGPTGIKPAELPPLLMGTVQAVYNQVRGFCCVAWPPLLICSCRM